MRATSKALAVAAVALIAAAALVSHYLALRSAGEWVLTLTVDGKPREFKLSELQLLAADVNITGLGSVKAVSLTRLLELCNVNWREVLVRSLTAVGADGYSKSINDTAFLHLPRIYVCLVGEAGGPLRLAAEGLSRKYWVKHLLSLKLETGGWALALQVNGEVRRVFELSELRASARSVEGVGTAVPLADLAAACGIDLGGVEVIELVSSDGYRATLHGRSATSVYALLVPEQDVRGQGPLRAVVLEAPKASWVRYLVAVNLVTSR